MLSIPSAFIARFPTIFSFSTMMTFFFVDTRRDWSSARPTPTQEFLDEMFFIVSNCMLFNTFVYLAFVLFLQLYRRLVCRWLFPSSTPTSTSTAISTSTSTAIPTSTSTSTAVSTSTSTATSTSTSTATSTRIKSKFRVLRVVKRSHPLYWHIPVTCFDDFEAASRIVAPGRTFMHSGRRTLPIILESERRVYFTSEILHWKTHIVPRDEDNERARRSDANDVYPHPNRPMMNQTSDDDFDPDFDGDRDEEIDVQNMDDCKPTSDVVSTLDSNNKLGAVVLLETCLFDDSHSQNHVDEVTVVLPLRRSARLAAIKQRQQSGCNKVPELLGSMFVNGRRRSARLLKSNRNKAMIR